MPTCRVEKINFVSLKEILLHLLVSLHISCHISGKFFIYTARQNKKRKMEGLKKEEIE